MGRRRALNPPGAERAFLRGLQASFPGWGGPEDLRWWFRREVGGPVADLLLLLDGDHGPVAGAAVCHRLVRGLEDAGAGAARVAILSGAWTDPRHRRQGCFRELIAHGREVAARRGAGALLAFAAAERASTPALTAAAAGVVGGWGLRTAGSAAPARPAAALASGRQPSAADLHRWFAARPGAGMVYGDAARFAVQARLRRRGTVVVPAGPGHWAIVEGRGGVARVHAVLSEDGPLTAAGWADAFAALAASPPVSAPLLGYTTRSDVAGGPDGDLDASAASVFVLPAGDTDPTPFLAASWWLQGLDRA